MKVYITRDEDSDEIWVWLNPQKGTAKPQVIPDYPVVNYQRPDSMSEIDTYFCYNIEDFKKLFGFIIKEKTIKKTKLDEKVFKDKSKIKY